METYRSEKQNTLWRFNAKCNEFFWMKQRCLNDLSKLLNLLLAATNIRVGDIRLLLDLHHCDSWIDFGRQRDVNLILVSVNTNTHALLNVCRCHRISKIDDKLCKLLDINDVLGIIRIGIDDFCAACDLEWLLILKCLLISTETALLVNGMRFK